DYYCSTWDATLSAWVF
nr:immunoglobulin light chain junction region [Macaca mulatta]